MEKHGVSSVIGACDGEDKCDVKPCSSYKLYVCVCAFLEMLCSEDPRRRFICKARTFRRREDVLVVFNNFKGRFGNLESCKEVGVISLCNENSHKARGTNMCAFLLKAKKICDVMGADLSQR